MKDDFLIKRIRAGAAEELIRGYYPQIMRFCRWQCGSGDIAEDLTQETFFQGIQKPRPISEKGTF